MQVIEAVEKIQEAAAKNQANPLIRRIVVPVIKIGEYYRQGDLYIIKVEDNLKVGERLERRQLAEGESIGQRHVLLGNFAIYKTIKQGNYRLEDLNIKSRAIGFTFDVIDNGEDYPVINAHPEHAHYYFPKECKGRYQVVHQTDLQTLQRAAD